jgi:broad specificity phosphatase PhoE
MGVPTRYSEPSDDRGEATLRTLRTVAPSGKAALLVRHAAREDGPTPADWVLMEEEWPLTPEGRVTARRFGGELPEFGHLFLTHTPRERTRDTANQIALGFLEHHPNSRASTEGVYAELGLTRHYAKDMGERNRWLAKLGLEFHRGWLDGRIPESAMTPAREAVGDLVERIRKKVEGGPESSLHLSVSHDVTLYTIRQVLFGPSGSERVGFGFLDGILLTWDAEGRWSARWREELAHGVPGNADRPGAKRGRVS